jgi:methionine aminopeptidase
MAHVKDDLSPGLKGFVRCGSASWPITETWLHFLTIREFAERHGFSVNEQFTGHSIGRNFHEEPYILHYRMSSWLLTQWGCLTRLIVRDYGLH